MGEDREMSKQAWFRIYEHELNEHPELSDEENADRADEKLTDQWADRADMLRDEAKYEEGESRD